MRVDYSNPPLTYDEQITLLQERGMIIDDSDLAKHVLSTIGFQTFLNYAKSYELENKRFDINVSTIYTLAFFDIELKSRVFESLTLFEVKFREAWAYHLSHEHGIHAYKDESLYKDKEVFSKILSKLFQDIKKSKNPSIVLKRKKYNIETLPNYVVKDVFSFGQLSKHFNNFAVHKTCNLIGQEFGLEGDVLKSWFNLFVEVRNIIAHHNILCNITMIGQPESQELYNKLSMIQFILLRIVPDHNILNHLKQHSQFLPHMGFPPDWQDKPIWNLQKETP